mgnify:CR=1 FL=1
MAPRIEIKMPKLLLVEGADARSEETRLNSSHT